MIFKANMDDIKWWMNQRREWRQSKHWFASSSLKKVDTGYFNTRYNNGIRHCTRVARQMIVEQRVLVWFEGVLTAIVIGAIIVLVRILILQSE